MKERQEERRCFGRRKDSVIRVLDVEVKRRQEGTSMTIEYLLRAHRKRKSKLGGRMIGAACVKRPEIFKSAKF